MHVEKIGFDGGNGNLGVFEEEDKNGNAFQEERKGTTHLPP